MLWNMRIPGSIPCPSFWSWQKEDALVYRHVGNFDRSHRLMINCITADEGLFQHPDVFAKNIIDCRLVILLDLFMGTTRRDGYHIDNNGCYSYHIFVDATASAPYKHTEAFADLIMGSRVYRLRLFSEWTLPSFFVNLSQLEREKNVC